MGVKKVILRNKYKNNVRVICVRHSFTIKRYIFPVDFSAIAYIQSLEQKNYKQSSNALLRKCFTAQSSCFTPGKGVIVPVSGHGALSVSDLR